MKCRRLFVAAVLGLAGCVDGGRSSGPSFAISDAVHGEEERNPFFYWLPPLVAAPTPTGEFNPLASPTVRVCVLDSTGCAVVDGSPILVAHFSMTAGTASEIIRIDLTNEHYIVNWHTDASNLEPTVTYRIIVSANGKDLGHADLVVGSTGKELKDVDRDAAIPLIDGRTLPIKFRIEVGAACVGIEGGCAEALVDPAIQEIVAVVANGHPLAFAEFPVGWADGQQLVRIERIPDSGFEPGEGPLGTEFPQYPLFFHYFTSVQDSFNLPVRIGVCNVENPAEDAYHPDSRLTTALAMGETGKFRILPSAPASDILGNCSGATRETAMHGGALPRWLGNLAAELGRPLGELLLPSKLHATALVVDGGMGGSTQEFSPAGTVDTSSSGSPAAIDLSGVSLPSLTLPLGQTALATVTLRNHSLITVRDVQVVAWVEQGLSSRSAGTAPVACEEESGSVPPGTCTVQFTLQASNSAPGIGTLVSGAAVARFTLQRSGAVADTVAIPILLTTLSTPLGL